MKMASVWVCLHQDPNGSCLAPLTEPEMKTSGNLCAPNSDLGNYYPVSNEAVDNAARVAIPGGGEVLRAVTQMLSLKLIFFRYNFQN